MAQAKKENGLWFRRGLRDGIPIAMGYFAVAFTLGITAKQIGMSVLQSAVMSLTMLASAGEFATMTVIASGSSCLVMVITTIVVNMRYVLMSASLSQKIDPKTGLLHRLGISYAVTDEIFGVASSVDGYLNPFYNYGMAAIAAPGWTLGTALGAAMGAILPVRAANAMGVALYGMFLAIIIPPAKKDRIIAIIVVISMAASYLCTLLPGVRSLSSGMRIILLTVVIAAFFAWKVPVEDPGEAAEPQEMSAVDTSYENGTEKGGRGE